MKIGLVIGLVLVLIGLMMVVLVPPSNDLIVFGLVSLLTAATFMIAHYFMKVSYALLASVFVGVLLTMNYFIGFQVLNTFLLTSFIIGIVILTKK